MTPGEISVHLCTLHLQTVWLDRRLSKVLRQGYRWVRKMQSLRRYIFYFIYNARILLITRTQHLCKIYFLQWPIFVLAVKVLTYIASNIRRTKLHRQLNCRLKKSPEDTSQIRNVWDIERSTVVCSWSTVMSCPNDWIPMTRSCYIAIPQLAGLASIS